MIITNETIILKCLDWLIGFAELQEVQEDKYSAVRRGDYEQGAKFRDREKEIVKLMPSINELKYIRRALSAKVQPPAGEKYYMAADATTEIHPMDKAWEEFEKTYKACHDFSDHVGAMQTAFENAWQAAEKHFTKQ